MSLSSDIKASNGAITSDSRTKEIKRKPNESSSFFKSISSLSNWILNSNVSVNSFARNLIVGGFLAGTAYSFQNVHPNHSGQPDFEGGAAIAIGTTMMISGVTAAIQYMRGRKSDALKWAGAFIFAGSVGSGVTKSNQLGTYPIQDPNEVPKDYTYLKECRPLDSSLSKISRLSCEKFEIGKEYVDQKKYLEQDNKDVPGHTPTYIYREIGLVMQRDNWRRALAMDEAFQLCQKNGYSHLKIAEGTVYKNFIIESLLPIDQHGIFSDKKQMGLYLENLDLFTPAVKEFTGLLCQATHDDLNSEQAQTLFSVFSNDLVPRFDNAALYLDEGVGKIVIPDLDDFVVGAPAQPQIDDVIRFFPYHYDQIIDEAIKYYPNLDRQDPKLIKIRDQALEFYENAYLKHLNHIESKGINLSQPDNIPELSEQTLNDIEAFLPEIIYQKCQSYGRWYKELLSQNKEDILAPIRATLKETVQEIREFLAHSLKNKTDVGHKRLHSERDLVEYRSLFIKDEELKAIVMKLAIRLHELNPVYEHDIFSPAIPYVESLLKELVNREVIAFYHKHPSGYVIFA